MNIIFFTDSDLKAQKGGLERACLTFIDWTEASGHSCSSISSVSQLIQKLGRDQVDIVFFVGHRSLKILAASFLLKFVKGVKVYWCSFWHDYKLEKNKYLLAYMLYDILFKAAFQLSNLQLYVSEYEKLKICSAGKSHRVILPTFIEEVTSIPAWKRDIDVLLYGRDVPHKQFALVRSLCKNLSLNLCEIDAKHPVSEAELKAKLVRTKYVLVPSYYESYSLVALEALSTGCSVIASDYVMVKDLLFDHPNYHVLKLADFNEKNVRDIVSRGLNSIDRSYSVRLAFSDWNCKREFEKIFLI